MARCRVIKQGENWNVGDHVEAFDDRLKELVDKGIVVVEVPDPVEVKEVEVVVEKPVKRSKKGVK